jgi:hypothetical protein
MKTFRRTEVMVKWSFHFPILLVLGIGRLCRTYTVALPSQHSSFTSFREIIYTQSQILIIGGSLSATSHPLSFYLLVSCSSYVTYASNRFCCLGNRFRCSTSIFSFLSFLKVSAGVINTVEFKNS